MAKSQKKTAGVNQTSPRRYTPITNDEIARIAASRFGQDSGGRMLSVAELARIYNRDPAQITRLLRRAFEERIVELRSLVGADDSNPRGSARDIEEQLENQLGLIKATVVSEIGEPADDTAAALALHSDQTHHLLGEAAAKRLIGSGMVFRDNDIIGVGPGRAVDQTIKALAKQPGIRAENVTLRSLSGDVHARYHSGTGVYVDADRHVSDMALCFPRRGKLEMVSRQIAYSSRTECDIARSHSHLQWKDNKAPNLILAGVGVYSAGHQWFESVTPHAGPNEVPIKLKTHVLHPIKELLERLAKNCKDHQVGDHLLPVMDIANHLLHINPPEWTGPPESGPEGIWEKIRTQVADINAHTLTVRLDQIRKIPIMLVAGTIPKAQAIHRLFELRLKVRYLCTDLPTAERLLALRS